jgi:hypothetical protein
MAATREFIESKATEERGGKSTGGFGNSVDASTLKSKTACFHSGTEIENSSEE